MATSITTDATISAPLPPGPSGPAAVSALARLGRDPWFEPIRLLEEYGDVVRVPMPFTELILLGHRDHIAHVNLKAAAKYQRAPMVTETMRAQGSPHHASWFDHDDDEWARGRELLQPHFTQKALAALGELFTEAVIEHVDAWGHAADSGETLDLVEPLKELALAVLYNAMFSRRIAHDEMPELLHHLDERMLATTVRTGMFAMPDRVPRPFSRRGARSDAWLDDYLRGIVDERRRNPVETTDLLNVLLGAEYADGTPLEDHKLRTEMLFLVIGGHETTAAALAWTFAFLGSRPDLQARARDEVDRLDGRRLGPADLAELPFITACFDEAQRLQGSLVVNPKRALVDDEIGGYRIPAGATVLHSNIALHRDRRFWGADADSYRPDRWLDGDIDNGAFQSFGRGRRMCMGKRFAYIEAALTIGSALQRYTFTTPVGWQPRHEYRMSMTVKGGVPLSLRRRASGQD
ncbi:cytochrome P450 [Paraconexibacter algicola]|uniref:Cytochrome P450 n=1 Tax=Paraconexibacter algicola TaxID=2133960 RepID=A0A2T4UL44_9ACTN|nr:cytochrome P450 [Paraconexibacter algicola]PTL59941.1 cytochrome P450 [Paraconexibacter algicola]